jgi:hypothetical protein
MAAMPPRLMTFLILPFAIAIASAQAPSPAAPADAAAERKLLDDALGYIRDKKYVFAVARLAPLVKSQTLPAPVVKAIPALIADLRGLDAVTQLAAAAPDRPFPAVAIDLLPPPVKRPYAWLELLRAVGVLLDTPLPPGTALPWTAEQANALLESIAADFDPDAAGKLRVELSAKLFLVGKPLDATKLIEDETPNEYAREVLADLRTIVLGSGTLANPQVARFVPVKGLSELPGAAALVPPTLRDKWQRPKPPVATETTLAKLEQRARKETTTAAGPEVEKLMKRVSAATAAIRTELAGP